MSRFLILLAVIAGLAPQAPAQKAQPLALAPDQQRLAQLIAQSDGPYTKLTEGVWSTPYRGKNMSNLTVRVATAQGGIFFFVHLFDRKSIALSRNLLLKIAELNSSFDYGKVALSDDELEVRVDMRAKLMDLEEFKAMEAQAAAVGDEAYGVLRDFVQ